MRESLVIPFGGIPVVRESASDHGAGGPSVEELNSMHMHRAYQRKKLEA